MKIITKSEQFVPAHNTIWGIMEDCWDNVNPPDCFMFKNGFVQLVKEGHWFPYRPSYPKCHIQVNVSKPHLIENKTTWQMDAVGDWSKDL